MTTETTINLEDLRKERLRREVEFYVSDLGYLDFIKDCGAAPDAEFQPHGRYAQSMITWNGDIDPDNPEIRNFKSKLCLWPRGSFKSQAFTIGQAAWLIARDPNIRILICSETARQAQKFAAEVMKIVDSQWFRDRFGVHHGDKWKEASGVFYSALRTRQGIKDPTLASSGVGEVQTGAHWDVVLMDDVCSQENTKTPESIDSLWSWFSEVQSQLDPGTKLFVIGTLHHYNDIYCRIIKDPAIAATFEISKHAWCEPLVDPRGKDPTTLFFPKRLTRAFIADRKVKQVPRLFACFYENKPQTGDDQIFHEDYFHVIRDQDVPGSVWTYVLTDFAFTADEKKSKSKSDRCCFWVVSLDCNRTAYVRDLYIGRWRPSDSCRIVCDLWTRFQPLNVKGVGVEKTTHKELLMSLFEEVRRQTFIRPRFIEIAGRNQEIKDIRIESIEPRFRGGNIYFTEFVRQQFATKWKPMLDEMTEWPFSANDDIPDAISDLDKVDDSGKFYFPGPPPGWTPLEVKRFTPPTVDGRYNPDAKYPAREFTKNKEHDLWGSKNSDSAPGSLFRGTSNQSNRDIFGPQ